ncbi:Hypothetical protein SMAX5B_000656 [Scophthalmus maximus]|uniref:Uncharacterized protein n=1 Tax=Scophthalmus maximus TaxID=52904 RepID=A0A2U9B5Z5_SCOMX|nr:Hypothetical protein SMAX5B_000656 [Scophthalmus maximus]
MHCNITQHPVTARTGRRRGSVALCSGMSRVTVTFTGRRIDQHSNATRGASYGGVRSERGADGSHRDITDKSQRRDASRRDVRFPPRSGEIFETERVIHVTRCRETE